MSRSRWGAVRLPPPMPPTPMPAMSSLFPGVLAACSKRLGTKQATAAGRGGAGDESPA